MRRWTLLWLEIPAFEPTYLAAGSGTDRVEEAHSWGHLCGILQFEGAFRISPLCSAHAILKIKQTCF